MPSDYHELIVWQRAITLVTEIYRVTAKFPKAEQWGLVSQLRRAAVSVPSNIAEGQSRSTTGEFRQFLGNGRGSLAEVHTQIIISTRLEYLDPSTAAKLEEMIDVVGKLLNGLIRSLGNPKKPTSDKQTS